MKFRQNGKWLLAGIAFAGVLCMLWAHTGAASARGFMHPAFKDPAMLEYAKQYSRKAVAQDPALGELLSGLGLEYVHQLDPSKVYSLHKTTKKIGVAEASDAQAASVGVSATPGMVSIPTIIGSAGGNIAGSARTVITCPLAPQTAEVKGFMASTVSRDPIGGIRSGSIYLDNFISTGAEVNFSILRVPGGARNPMNRTVMETTHSGFCGSEVIFQNVVTTWPPLRIELTIDDTGSMGGELAGVKAALTNFIAAHNTDLNKKQRGVSYELISFKDSPTLALSNTENTTAAISAVNALAASGGGDCPEDSLGAVSMALGRLAGDEDSAGEIVLVTDASPRTGDIGAIIAQARSLGVPVHVMLSGDCGETAALASAGAAAAALSTRALYEKLATETGGLYFFKPGGTVQDYTDILGEIFETAVTGGDTEPPKVSVGATPTTLWPSNHKMVRIDTKVSATDDKDPAPVITLVGVTSSEPEDGQGDGHTESDIRITKDGSIYVRAERSGNSKGRTYTITYQAADQKGNVGFGSVDIVVPHNR